MDEEESARFPPSSIVPRVHCVEVKLRSHINPLLSSDPLDFKEAREVSEVLSTASDVRLLIGSAFLSFSPQYCLKSICLFIYLMTRLDDFLFSQTTLGLASAIFLCGSAFNIKLKINNTYQVRVSNHAEKMYCRRSISC